MRARGPLVVAAVLSLASCREHPGGLSEPGTGAAPVKILYPAAPGSFVKLVERLRPSIVGLATVEPVRGGPAELIPGGGPGEVVGLTGDLGERMRRSLGSGFIVDATGTILTNAHLLGKDREIRVRLEDGAELPAKVVGQDAASDLAVLTISPPSGTHLQPLRFGDSNELQVGEWVAALGNPFGMGVTLSVGVVSAKPRRDLPRGEAGYLGFVQTDAAIHAGNSGGPLCNAAGEVIGVSSALSADTGRIGFALPSAMVQKILPALRREGRIVRAWVGIYMDKVTPELAQRAGLKGPQGALVRSVVPGGPAEKAGLRTGDIILSFEDREVTDAGDLPWRAALAGANRIIPLKVWRDRKTLRFSLRTERMPE
jgi:serine protease Do